MEGNTPALLCLEFVVITLWFRKGEVAQRIYNGMCRAISIQLLDTRAFSDQQ